MRGRPSRIFHALVAGALVAGAVVGAGTGTAAASTRVASFADVVPAPVTAQPSVGVTFSLGRHTKIYTPAGSPPAAAVGSYLASMLRGSTGYQLPVVAARAGVPECDISLLLTGADASIGNEGYQLDVTARAVTIRANTAAGLFAGVQTLRQLLPAKIESREVVTGPWKVPGGRVIDHPRFAYRGAMLDVARHFFTVEQVKRYIDHLALYKINRFHLHLADDQGWRIMINSWPRLATYGGITQVGGGPGGYYTQAQYAEIVAYAQQRYITVVPEVDMPGHVNAALASYAELNCDGIAPPLYTGTAVGFSSLCVGKEITYRFVEDVVREIAALTPGGYVHIGGDEAHATSHADYQVFMGRAQQIVARQGKKVQAWHQIVEAAPLPSTFAQYWDTARVNPAVAAATNNGTRLLLSPANKIYLDMKYNPATPLGLDWAGLIEVRDAYDWDPGAHVQGVNESSIEGVEAPLWTETTVTSADIDFMAFPRLPAVAELGWSSRSAHDWDAFSRRLGAQGPRWGVMGINFYRSPQVPWSAS
jgi:hexosaminidase